MEEEQLSIPTGPIVSTAPFNTPTLINFLKTEMKQLPLIPVVQLDLTLGMQVERHQTPNYKADEPT